MTHTPLTDRYVYAALRHLPAASRADVGRELHTLIEDGIQARVQAGAAPEAAERAVLEELGEPERLAARYTGRELVLIGPALFPTWRKVVTIVAAVVTPLVALGVVVGGIADGDRAASVVGDALGAAAGSLIHLAFWVTLAFAILERTGRASDLADPWTLDDLPELPAERQLALPEAAFGVATLLLAIGFFPWQQLQPLAIGDGAPLLDPDAWLPWLALMMAALAGELLLTIAVYRRGHWTWRSVALNVLASLTFAVPAIWLLLDGSLINPAFISAVGWPTTTVDAVNTGVAISIAIVTAIDIGDAAWKAWQASPRSAAANA